MSTRRHRLKAIMALLAFASILSMLRDASAVHAGVRKAEPPNYQELFEKSQWSNYLDHREANFYIEHFGVVPKIQPFQTVAYGNSSLLVLDSSALPKETDSPRTCEDRPTCCGYRSGANSCRAWFSFFEFCYSKCRDESSCTAVEVRMASAECALYHERTDCFSKEMDGAEPTSDNSFVIARTPREVNAPLSTSPAGYTLVVDAGPAISVKTLKEIALSPEPCGSDWLSVREDNIQKCATNCNDEPKCTGFVYALTDKTGDLACKLYASVKGEWELDYELRVLYLKNSTVNCNGKEGEYFSYTYNGGVYTCSACQPYIAEGEVCKNRLFDYTDLTTKNNGCAPGFGCVGVVNDYDRICAKLGTFLEEAKRQLSRDPTAVLGKALPNSTDGKNSSDLLFFDFSHHNWDYLEPIAYECSQLCGAGDVNNECIAYELNSETKSCVLGFSRLCGSSLVANENAVTVFPADTRMDSLMIVITEMYEEIRTELDGFQLVVNYVPVIPALPNENVRIVDIPCDRLWDDSYLAIATDCVKQCNQWDGCHSIVFQPQESSCALLANQTGIEVVERQYAPPGQKDVDTIAFFTKPTRAGCAKNQFLGILTETTFVKRAGVKYDDKTWVEEWDQIKAARGFTANGGSNASVLAVDWSDSSVSDSGSALAICIDYIQDGSICRLDGVAEEQFTSLTLYKGQGEDREFVGDGCMLGSECTGSDWSLIECTDPDVSESCVRQVQAPDVCQKKQDSAVD